ncbi:TPA: hypothetical protein N0F65_002751 [Lagenidium giganteum]|uniref:DUF7869 domain-containing protein n=1 Tax=Lagenidium giganteum TaxID=4803 RepID=A0AAV2YM92_9STRA|nr:TPA: hypothetical protein N0F65_002751 [Lagenidium giganteum]
MDFSQNLTLPSVSQTPSEWYFLSMINYQYNFLYSERKGRKGANEIFSMLHRPLRVYADNCDGQNKNNFAIRFFLLLAHLGWFRTVHYKVLIKGHTKIACDRDKLQCI